MPEKTVLEVLREARELIAVPERWTQGGLARDAQGKQAPGVYNRDAASWCAEGAICKTAGTFPVARAAFAAVRETLAGAELCEFNDSHTHPEVVSLIDSTIARLEKEADRA